MTCSEMAAAARPLRVGDVVEVRSPEEILVTLDERGGETENLPFMPEMLQFCGRQLTVHKVAHKLCDTINRSGIHRMENAVHLTGARCDGSSTVLSNRLLALLEGGLAQTYRTRNDPTDVRRPRHSSAVGDQHSQGSGSER